MILGVDPGSSATGVVAREGDDLLWHTTVSGGWETVLTVLRWDLAPVGMVAIEDVVAPSYYRGKKLLDPRHAIETCRVAAAVAGWAWTSHLGVVWVPPGHNGQGALDAYPPELRPSRGQGRGADRLRHCRSGWDVAGLGALLMTREVTVSSKVRGAAR